MKISRIKILAVILTTLFFGCESNPDNLKYETNLVGSITQSKIQNKPIFIHFTGFGAGGTNEFLDKLITSKKVQNILNEEYIMVQLFVDDNTGIKSRDTIGISEIIKSPKGRERVRNVKTVGKLNIAIEIELLNKNTQPNYMIVNDSLKPIIEPFGYSKGDRKEFISKLKEGIRRYN